MSISRYNTSDSGYDHLTRQSPYDKNNHSDNFNWRETSTTQSPSNTNPYPSSLTSNSHTSKPPVGQFYAIEKDSKVTYHMNVVSENCIYAPTGYSKKVYGTKIKPSKESASAVYVDKNRESSKSHTESFRFPSHGKNGVEPDASSASSSYHSDEEDHKRRKDYRQRVENHYLRLSHQEKLSPNSESALGDAIAQNKETGKCILSQHIDTPELGIDKSLWMSIDRERNKLLDKQRSDIQTTKHVRINPEPLPVVKDNDVKREESEEETEEEFTEEITYIYVPKENRYVRVDNDEQPKSNSYSVSSSQTRYSDGPKSSSSDGQSDITFSPSHSSAKSSPARSRYESDYEVSEKTKPYIEMTHRVRESSSNPSGVDVFEQQPIRMMSRKQDSFSKSTPSSPVTVNVPLRAVSAKGSVTSDRSSRLDPYTYQSYAAGILYSTGKSEQYLKLQKHFSVLERISEIEDKSKNRTKYDTLPKSKLRQEKALSSQYDFDKEEELDELYGELEEAKRNKEFFYRTSNIDTFQWKPDKDAGLLRKEKSLHDLRSAFLEEKRSDSAHSFSLEDEIKRETDFNNLYQKYKSEEHPECDDKKPEFPERSLIGPSYLDMQMRNSAQPKSLSRPLYGSNIEKPLNSYEVHVEKVKKMSKSEPNINNLHVRCMSAPAKRNPIAVQQAPLQRSDSSKESFFGRKKAEEPEDVDDFSVVVGSEHSHLPNDMYQRSDKIFTKNTLESLEETDYPMKAVLIDKPSSDQKTDIYDGDSANEYGYKKKDKNLYKPFFDAPLHNTGEFERDLKMSEVDAVNSKPLINNPLNKENKPNRFTVKDLRGLAENNEFSQSKFGQLRRVKSLHESFPSAEDGPKNSVPAPPVRKNKLPSENSSEQDYVFRYKDLGHSKKNPLNEKLVIMQKLNDERSRDLDRSVISSISALNLKSQPDLIANTRDNDSIKPPKRHISGNSIFHKQKPSVRKSLPEADVSSSQPLYPAPLYATIKDNIVPKKSNHDESFGQTGIYQPMEAGGPLRRWQPQNLTDIGDQTLSSFVHSSTETFIENSDEDLSASQSSVYLEKKKDELQPSLALEKSKSEPKLNTPEFTPKRPRSAKSQSNLHDKKEHWRRSLGKEYVNEPAGGMTRTISGDLVDVYRNSDGQVNPFYRFDSSESQTSPEPNRLIEGQSREELKDRPSEREQVAMSKPVYSKTYNNETHLIPSKYHYDPYIPPSDIMKHVTGEKEVKSVRNPVPKTRKPSDVSRMTMEYFDSIGGEWKYGNKPNSINSSNQRLSDSATPLTPSALNPNSSPSVRVRLPTYGGNSSVPYSKSSDQQPQQQFFSTNQITNIYTKPSSSKRSAPQYYGNVTDQDKIMHSSLSNSYQHSPFTSSTNSLDRRNLKSRLNVVSDHPASSNSHTKSLSSIPPPPSRKVPPAPIRKSGAPSSSFMKSLTTMHETMSKPNMTMGASTREWTPAHVKKDEQNKGNYPNTQIANAFNDRSNGVSNMTQYDPEATSQLGPASPSNLPSPPDHTIQSPTIKPIKLRMPRSSLSAAEQLGVKNTSTVKSNENGAFKHQTSDVKRAVPISEKERRRKEEEKLYRRQRLEQLYEEERKRKQLQEEQDLESRRHNDFFIPSMKSPIPNDRFNDINGTVGGSGALSVGVTPSAGMATLSVPVERRRGFQIQGKAKALYNFNAQNSREMSFRKGDIIYLLRQIDKNWFEGERYGRQGIFPVNYVEVMTSIEAAQQAAVQAEGQGRVKYNFTAQSPMELSLRKGEYVTLLRTVDENWFEGRSGNKQGIFPASYVDILQEPSTPLITPAPSVICTPMTGRGTPEMLSPVGYDAPTPPPQPSPSAFNQSRLPASQFGFRPQQQPLSPPQQQSYHQVQLQQQQQQPQQMLSPGALRSQSNPLSPINQELEQRIFSPKSQLSPTQPKKQVTINTIVRTEPNPPPTKPGYGVKSKVPDDDLAINRYRAIYAYRPQNEDELELQEGDEVYVMEQCDDGWYVGTSGRTGNFGTFPGNYVQLICKTKFVNSKK